MKKEMWKQLLQIIITILTAISSSLFVQSCVKSHSSSSTVRQYAPASSRQQLRLTRGIANEAGLDIRGRPADTRTEAQRCSLRKLIEQLHAAYPKALIVGHHDLNPMKDCPCFDVAKEYAVLQP